MTILQRFTWIIKKYRTDTAVLFLNNTGTNGTFFKQVPIPCGTFRKYSAHLSAKASFTFDIRRTNNVIISQPLFCNNRIMANFAINYIIAQ